MQSIYPKNSKMLCPYCDNACILEYMKCFKCQKCTNFFLMKHYTKSTLQGAVFFEKEISNEDMVALLSDEKVYSDDFKKYITFNRGVNKNLSIKVYNAI